MRSYRSVEHNDGIYSFHLKGLCYFQTMLLNHSSKCLIFTHKNSLRTEPVGIGKMVTNSTSFVVIFLVALSGAPDQNVKLDCRQFLLMFIYTPAKFLWQI